MADITRQFANMLNESLTEKLLEKTLEERCYVYNKLEKDQTWKGGDKIVPIKGGNATSVAFGKYTAEADIAQASYLRGKAQGYKTAVHSLVFNHRDLVEHNGKVNEDSFLSALEDQVDDASTYFKNVMSIGLLNGPYYDKTAAAGAVGGTVKVAHIERFEIGQKIKVGAAALGYVTAVNLNTEIITVQTARSAGSNIDLSGQASGSKIYLDGQDSHAFFSIKEALLPLANGGSDTLHTLTKSANPYTQSVVIDGTTWTSQANLLKNLFNALTTVRQKARGSTANTIAMSWRNLGYVMQALENVKSPFKTKEGSMAATNFGFTEIEVISVANGQAFKVVGIAEMEDDWMAVLNFADFKFASNGTFRRVATPEGNEFYTVRGTDGYKFIVDIELYGDLIAQKAAWAGAIHSIPAMT